MSWSAAALEDALKIEPRVSVLVQSPGHPKPFQPVLERDGSFCEEPPSPSLWVQC